MELQGSLKGVRILDFTWAVAGPFATSILGDHGAEVIKVEGRERTTTLYQFFSSWNRSKLSVIINMRHPKGLEVTKRLLKISDVVIENFSAGVMESWGFGYEVMKSIKPDIIYVSMSGFGHTGPYRDYVSNGPTLQCLAGFTLPSGFPCGMPTVMGAYSDFMGGLHGALAVLMALEYRKQTGKGQYVDLAQLEATAAYLDTAILDYTVNGRVSQPMGNRLAHPAAAPHGAYQCLGDDRWCAIAVFSEDEWQAFCRAIGNPPWTQEPRFATLPQRVQHADELDKLVEQWTNQRSAEEVMGIMQRAGVAAGVVQNAEDLVDKDPHLRARGFWERAYDPVFGETTFEGVPVCLSETPGRVQRGAPLFGEHNNYIFGTLLGMSPEEIQQYTEEGVFRGVPAPQ